MADYVRWNCRDLESGNEELRGALAKVSSLTEELRSVHRRLDPQLAEYEGIGRSLRTLADGTEEDARRIQNECNALDGVRNAYAAAERTVMQASESLPTSITERNLIFEGWFTDLLR